MSYDNLIANVNYAWNQRAYAALTRGEKLYGRVWTDVMLDDVLQKFQDAMYNSAFVVFPRPIDVAIAALWRYFVNHCDTTKAESCLAFLLHQYLRMYSYWLSYLSRYGSTRDVIVSTLPFYSLAYDLAFVFDDSDFPLATCQPYRTLIHFQASYGLDGHDYVVLVPMREAIEAVYIWEDAVSQWKLAYQPTGFPCPVTVALRKAYINLVEKFATELRMQDTQKVKDFLFYLTGQWSCPPTTIDMWAHHKHRIKETYIALPYHLCRALPCPPMTGHDILAPTPGWALALNCDD